MELHGSPNNGTVMIVDDTPGNLAVLSDTLSEANYRVLVATDGLSALEQIQYLKPDIILLDVLMPGIDGFDTCRKIKANPETSEIPVLFMTGMSELDYLLRGFGEGALDYIVKPIRPPEVLARIEVHLSQSRNIRRAHYILNNGIFSALTIDSTGCIKWLTPAAKDWLYDFQQSVLTRQTVDLGDFIPFSLLEWFKKCLLHPVRTELEAGVQYRSESGFTARMIHCRQAEEYLLLLQKEQPVWDINNLRAQLKLTFREAEILMWIARGKTNKEVGIILDTSPRTVNKHMEHIFEKLGVATRAAAVAMALKR
jgi:DNA-binding response OmpR family regulator/DNA-binding CsgD family transcriptional regulator